MNQIWVTKYQAAERLSRTPRTVARWIAANELEQIGEGRYAKYRLGDLLQIRNDREANEKTGLFSALRQPDSAGMTNSALARSVEAL